MSVHLSKMAAAILILFLAISCKKNPSQNSTNPEPSISYQDVANTLAVQERASLKVEQYFQNTTDTIAVLFNTAQWLLDQPEVEEVYLISDYILEVRYKPGITSDIVLNFIDPSGEAYFRGGGGSGSSLTAFGDPDLSLKKLQDKIIENKKVMVFVPFDRQFIFPENEIRDLIENSPLDLEVDIKLDKQANLDAVRSFGDYGLIVLNTHGMPGAFRIKTDAPLFSDKRTIDTTVVTPASLVEQQMLAAGITLAEVENGEIKINADVTIQMDANKVVLGYEYRYSIWVTDKFVRKMPKLNEAVVFDNSCFSGYTIDGPNTLNLAEAFKSIGAITYFGYAKDDKSSAPVDNSFAQQVEKSLYQRLLYQIDSTGVAHLKSDGTEWEDPLVGSLSRDGKPRKIVKMMPMSEVKEPKIQGPKLKLKHFFDPEYRYESPCGIFKDERDGEVYTTVCIGDQIWFAQNLRYNAPGSKDPQFGGASLKGKLYDYNTVTAGGAVWHMGDPVIQGICPKGWHVPHSKDWEKLYLYEGAILNTDYPVDWIKTVGPENIQASLRLVLKSHITPGSPYYSDPNVNISGFNAKDMGHGVKYISTGAFSYKNDYYVYFWSSSPLGKRHDQSSNTWAYDFTQHYALEINSTPLTGGTSFDPAVVSYFYPCRCVKDD